MSAKTTTARLEPSGALPRVRGEHEHTAGPPQSGSPVALARGSTAEAGTLPGTVSHARQAVFRRSTRPYAAAHHGRAEAKDRTSRDVRWGMRETHMTGDAQTLLEFRNARAGRHRWPRRLSAQPILLLPTRSYPAAAIQAQTLHPVRHAQLPSGNAAPALGRSRR